MFLHDNFSINFWIWEDIDINLAIWYNNLNASTIEVFPNFAG